MSLDPGWTTVSVVAAATAASTALPPRRSTEAGRGGERLGGRHDAARGVDGLA